MLHHYKLYDIIGTKFVLRLWAPGGQGWIFYDLKHLLYPSLRGRFFVTAFCSQAHAVAKGYAAQVVFTQEPDISPQITQMDTDKTPNTQTCPNDSVRQVNTDSYWWITQVCMDRTKEAF